MAVRKGVSFVLDDSRNMQHVARPPDTSFTVEEGFHSFLEHLSTHVEAAHRAFGGQLQISHASAGPAHHGERPVRDFDLRQAVASRFHGRDSLQLEVHYLQCHPAERAGGNQVRGREPQVFASGIFGHKANVGRKQLDARETVGIHVVRRLLRIIGIAPVVVPPVVVVIPVPRILHVPFGLLLLARGAVAHGSRAHRFLAAVEALILTEADPDAVDRSGLLLDEAAQIQAMVVPLVQVFRLEGDISFVDQTAAAADVAIFVQFVILQEHQNIVLVDLDYPHFHGAEIHSPEGKNQILLVRQDRSADRNFHGRFLTFYSIHAREISSKRLSLRVFDVFVDGEGHVSLAAFEIDRKERILHLSVTSAYAVKG